MDIIAWILFAFGAMIGSFLNVCIVRLPHNQSIVFPSSHCVKCKAPIAFYDNIPLLSYLLLGGKCRHCKAPYSIRYFFVELLTAFIFMGYYLYFGFSPELMAYLVMTSCFIVAIFVDFEHRIIPDEVSVGGMYLGILLSVLIPGLHPGGAQAAEFSAFLAGLIVLLCLSLTLIYPIFCKHLMQDYNPAEERPIKYLVLGSLLVMGLINSFLTNIPAIVQPYALSLSLALSGYLVGGGIIYAMGLLGDIMFKKESMGGGDVKLMAMVGAFLGWKLAILTFFIAPFFGAVYGIIEKMRTKDSTIAYGPFLVLGAIVSLFWGHQIIAWIMGGGMSL